MEEKEQIGLSGNEIIGGIVAGSTVVTGASGLYGATVLSDRAIHSMQTIASGAMNGQRVNYEAKIPHLKEAAQQWKAASLLKKPWIAFNAMPVKGRIGVVLAATVAAVGAVCGINRLRNCGCTHAEAIEKERNNRAHREI